MPVHELDDQGNLRESKEPPPPSNRLSGLKAEVRAHWKTFNPIFYQRMKAKNLLEKELDRRVERAKAVYYQAVRSGLDFAGAEELARQEWMLPPEPPTT